MATEKELYELIGRAVADPDFRASLLDNPEKAAREAGFELTNEQLAGLRAADLRGLSESLDQRLSKSGGRVCVIPGFPGVPGVTPPGLL